MHQNPINKQLNSVNSNTLTETSSISAGPTQFPYPKSLELYPSEAASISASNHPPDPIQHPPETRSFSQFSVSL
ncbi:hypothetical protein HanRHA438_Chr12g0563531 [Helianthus annuus]|nr:hypothetical protein HanRHA438_Chr12g0563531 [Helianthus annuus]